jgi:hypothetical protein
LRVEVELAFIAMVHGYIVADPMPAVVTLVHWR